MSEQLQDAELWRALPVSAITTTDLVEIARATNDAVRDLVSVKILGNIWKRLPIATKEELAHFAWWLRPPIWRDTWPLDKQRRVILRAIALKRRAGTEDAIREGARLLGVDYFDVVPWHRMNPVGEPYTFDVQLVLSAESPLAPLEDQKQIMEAVNALKSQRDVYTLTVLRDLTEEVHMTSRASSFTVWKLNAEMD